MDQKEFRAKWIEALRSGKYKQTTNALHRSNGGFCCLGVACDIYAKEMGIENPWKGFADDSSDTTKLSFNGYMDTLPFEVQRLLGLKTDLGSLSWVADPLISKFIYDDRVTALSELNDKGATFEEIADFIERRPELFVDQYAE